MNTDFNEIEKTLIVDGWILIRICGSHHCFKKPGNSEIVVIPYYSDKDVSPILIPNLERITGLSLKR